MVILSGLYELESIPFNYWLIIISLILNLCVLSSYLIKIIRESGRGRKKGNKNKFSEIMTDLDEELKRRKNKEKLERN